MIFVTVSRLELVITESPTTSGNKVARWACVAIPTTIASIERIMNFFIDLVLMLVK
jgi:hypothetical protein